MKKQADNAGMTVPEYKAKLQSDKEADDKEELKDVALTGIEAVKHMIDSLTQKDSIEVIRYSLNKLNTINHNKLVKELTSVKS